MGISLQGAWAQLHGVPAGVRTVRPDRVGARHAGGCSDRGGCSGWRHDVFRRYDNGVAWPDVAGVILRAWG